MKTLNRLIGWGLAGLLMLTPLAANAEILTVAPTQAAIFPDDQSGVTKVVLLFDLSALQEGEGRQIDSALLDWPATGVASDRMTEYTLHMVTESWTEQGVAAEAVPAFRETATDLWEFSERDYEYNGGGFLRFDMTSTVEDWLAGEATNYGVVVATEDLSRQGLSGQLNRPQLTIRYGFVR